jgi:hypothetical protein
MRPAMSKTCTHAYAPLCAKVFPGPRLNLDRCEQPLVAKRQHSAVDGRQRAAGSSVLACEATGRPLGTAQDLYTNFFRRGNPATPQRSHGEFPREGEPCAFGHASCAPEQMWLPYSGQPSIAED